MERVNSTRQRSGLSLGGGWGGRDTQPTLSAGQTAVFGARHAPVWRARLRRSMMDRTAEWQAPGRRCLWVSLPTPCLDLICAPPTRPSAWKGKRTQELMTGTYDLLKTSSLVLGFVGKDSRGAPIACRPPSAHGRTRPSASRPPASLQTHGLLSWPGCRSPAAWRPCPPPRLGSSQTQLDPAQGGLASPEATELHHGRHV